MLFRSLHLGDSNMRSEGVKCYIFPNLSNLMQPLIMHVCKTEVILSSETSQKPLIYGL